MALLTVHDLNLYVRHTLQFPLAIEFFRKKSRRFPISWLMHLPVIPIAQFQLGENRCWTTTSTDRDCGKSGSQTLSHGDLSSQLQGSVPLLHLLLSDGKVLSSWNRSSPNESHYIFIMGDGVREAERILYCLKGARVHVYLGSNGLKRQRGGF